MTKQISNLKFEISNRRGFTLLEVSVSGAMLVVLMVVTVQVLGWVAVERRAADRRQVAALEAANVMERLASQPWEDLTAERTAEMKLSTQARDVLPEGELKLEIQNESGQPEARRILIEVHWKGQASQPVAPVRLTSWIYRRGDGGK